MVRVSFKFFILFVLVLCFANESLAQQDSIVAQFWKRNPNTDPENTVSNQNQIITREQILYSGYTLLSDILQLVDGWTISTWNGDRWNMQNGSGTYQTQNWTLLLNGQRIELMKLDAQHLNLLGISANEIERIEIVNIQGNYLGEFNDKGIIHILTRKNKEGLTYRGYLSNGNEIGDPHLDALNNPSFNVHEYGSTIGNTIAFKKNKWNIQANQLFNQYFYRDTSDQMYPLVRTYNPSLNFSNSLLSGNVQVTYASEKITHHLTGIVTRADDVVMPAGIFNPITATHNYNFVGYTLRDQLSSGVLQYRGTAQNRIFTGIDQKQYSHEQINSTHNLNYTTRLNSKKGSSIKQWGLAYDYTFTRMTDSNSLSSTVHIIRPYFSFTHPLTRKSTLFTDIALASNTQIIAPKFVLGYYKQSSVIINWSFVGSYTQRGLIENNSFLNLLSITDTSLSGLRDEVSGSATIDYYFNININKYVKFSFNSGLKHMLNEPYFNPVATANTASPELLFTDIQQTQQTRWVNRFNFHYDMLKSTRFDFNYLRTAIWGDEWLNQNSIPKHRLSFILTQILPARLTLWTRYYYQSPTWWINPALFQLQTSTTSLPMYTQLSSVQTIDVGVTKHLLKEYLVASLSVRNMLNGHEQYQVNGAAFYMRLFVTVRLNIAGLFAKPTTTP